MFQQLWVYSIQKINPYYQYKHKSFLSRNYILGREIWIDFASYKLYIIDRKAHIHAFLVVLCCISPFGRLK